MSILLKMRTPLRNSLYIRILRLCAAFLILILKPEEFFMSLSDAELYEGLNQDKFDRYDQETRQAYDPKMVEQVNRKIRNLTKSQWDGVKEEGSIIAKNLSVLIDRDPKDPEVQSWIARQHAWIENFYPASAEIFRGLGKLYASNEEFRATYDQYKPGLADFMQKAMHFYADTFLTEAEAQD
jgi:hypothetical protein